MFARQCVRAYNFNKLTWQNLFKYSIRTWNIIGTSIPRRNFVGTGILHKNIIGTSILRRNIVGTSILRKNIIGTSIRRKNIIGTSILRLTTKCQLSRPSNCCTCFAIWKPLKGVRDFPRYFCVHCYLFFS